MGAWFVQELCAYFIFMPTEIWKQITIREIRGKYMVSESGRIKRIGYYLKSTGAWKSACFIKGGKNNKGYLRTNFSKNGNKFSVYNHRLVAMFFVENTNHKPHVNHIDGNKANNHYTNLEWCTPQENNEHGVKMGLLKRGRKPYVNTYVRKGQPEFVKPVIDLYTGIFWSPKEVAVLENTTRKYIHRMLNEERKPNTSKYRYA